MLIRVALLFASVVSGALRPSVRRIDSTELRRSAFDVSTLCAKNILAAEEPAETAILTAAVQKDLLERFSGSARGRAPNALLLAESDDGDIIGCCGIAVDVCSSNGLGGASFAQERPLLSNLAVSPKYRGKGIAKSLCREAEALALKEWEYDEVLLRVEESNPKARSLYRKIGYRVAAVDAQAKRPVAGPGGLRFVSTRQVLMRKSLKYPPIDTVLLNLAAAASVVYGYTSFQQPIDAILTLLAEGQLSEALVVALAQLPAEAASIMEVLRAGK